MPRPDATTLRAFATWKVRRELAARRAHQLGPDALATTMPKRWITAAIGLIRWHRLARARGPPRAARP
jgi:hypothetical protein